MRPSLLGQAPPGPVSAQPRPSLSPSLLLGPHFGFHPPLPRPAYSARRRASHQPLQGARETASNRPTPVSQGGTPEAPEGPLTLSHVPISARPATATARTSPLKTGLPARARCGGDVGAAPEHGCPARPHGPSLRGPRRKVPAAESGCIRPREGQTWGGQGPPNSDRIQPK